MEFLDDQHKRETPLMLLDGALKKLDKDTFSVDSISQADYPKARKIAASIRREQMKSSTNSTKTRKSLRLKTGEDKSVFVRCGSDGGLIIDDPSRILVGRHYSQLTYWGFRPDIDKRTFLSDSRTSQEALSSNVGKLLTYFSRCGIRVALSEDVQSLQDKEERFKQELNQALRLGALFKAGDAKGTKAKEFTNYIRHSLSRRLKDHQIKAALHLLTVKNGANFSVPGSGKTTVVLSVFQWLRSLGELDSLFVIGPPSCFGPWRTEYEAVTGKEPSWEILAGGNIEDRRAKYYSNKQRLRDLYLTSFQTLLHDWDKVKLLFNQRDVNFALVIDEAHYIKQLGGAWATAVLNIARYAKVRWVLTGTPFPCSFTDAFNAFDVLWPRSSPIDNNTRSRIQNSIRKKDPIEGATILDSCIGPLFYRVRKNDLKLAKQDFHEPIIVQMNKHERRVYDAVEAKVRSLSKDDFNRDYDLMLRLKKGRMMRLRQCVSYARLVGNAVSEYNELLADGHLSLANTIKHYDDLEIPAKLSVLLDIVNRLRQKGSKIVIWSNFVETLKLISHHLTIARHVNRLIYGAVPTELSADSEEMTRERIISEFLDEASKIGILIANPAACAESISLHKSCAHAIYYDLSYNCGQYVQSSDRIHRVGGSEHKVAHYYFLQYADTIDEDILRNIRRKAANMSTIIDRDYAIYSLDMFSEDDELEAYDRIFKRTV